MSKRPPKRRPTSSSSKPEKRATRTRQDPLGVFREALAVADVIDALNTAESTTALLDRILVCAVRAMGTEEGSITQLDQSKNELFFRAAHSMAKHELMKIRVPTSQGVLGYVARSGQPLCVRDVAEDEHFDSRVDDAVGFVTHSLIAAPILEAGEVIGVIELVNFVGEEDATQEDLAILGTFADIVSIVLAQERKRKGTLAFVEQALKSATLETGGEARTMVREVAKQLRSYKSDPAYKQSLKLAALVRDISRRGDEATKLAETILSASIKHLDSLDTKPKRGRSN